MLLVDVGAKRRKQIQFHRSVYFVIVLGETVSLSMRSFQVMRYGRRPTPTPHEILQSIIQSENLSTICRRPSVSALVEREQRSSCLTGDENDHVETQR